MRAVLQRVKYGAVRVDGAVVGQIDHGFVILVGVGHGDGEAEAQWLARKIAGLRVFEDADGKFNLSLLDVGGGCLVVSQFTLYADSRKGRRPSFVDAAPPEIAEPLIERFAGPFKNHLDRYKYPGRHGSDPIEHRTAGLQHLESLEQRLAASAFLCGSTRTLADIALFPFIRQFAATDQAWFDAQPLPQVHGWLAGLIGSDLFASVMLRLPPWQPGDAPTVFATG